MFLYVLVQLGAAVVYE